MTPHRLRLLVLDIGLALGAVLGSAVLDSRTAAHADWRQLAPWCAYLGGFGGNFDCAYYSLEQCLATARGLGNYCVPNPRAAYAPQRPPRRIRR
jgi:hypothetical protein